MSWAALRGDHPLAVYIDLKSPYAYLAVDPTRAMARAAGVAIDWRPFTLDIPSYLGSASLDTKGAVAASDRSPQQWTGVRYAYKDARRYANLTGKTVRGTVKIWDSSLAGIAMLWAKQHARLDALLDAAYPPFWRRELDIEDVHDLERVLRDAGVPSAGFAAYAEGPGRTEHDALNAAAFAAGVFGVPTYLVADEIWFGREHLPRVAWLLAGARGQSPDVENRSFAAPAAIRAGLGGDARSDLGRVTVLLDLRDPASYLALHPAVALGRALGVAIDWLPLTGPAPKRPSAPARGDDRGALHRRHRAHALAREIEVYAHARGLELREPYRDADASVFVLGWLWLRERAPERVYPFLAAGFQAYWSLALDPSCASAVAALLRSVGDDALGFDAWCAGDGARTSARIADELRERGLFGAPGYLVDGEYFIGRQHLPMIRWILGGRAGPGPI